MKDNLNIANVIHSNVHYTTCQENGAISVFRFSTRVQIRSQGRKQNRKKSYKSWQQRRIARKAFVTVPIGMRYDSTSFDPSNFFEWCREDCQQGKKFKRRLRHGWIQTHQDNGYDGLQSQLRKRKANVLRLEDTYVIHLQETACNQCRAF